MRVHLIFDFQFLYYKYKFALDSGRMKRLTAPVDCGGVNVEKDISQIYYAIREIENIRRKLEYNGHDLKISICFDSKSARKNGEGSKAQEYKANRVSKLNENDFDNIKFVKNLLSDAGYNVYKIDGIEADDIINNLVNKYSDDFDYTMIVTCDLDIAVNIKKNVGLYRFKSTSGYSSISFENFNTVVDQELKCHVPYNAIMLFKCTVGDKSDNIAGIKKFGPAAFTKMVSHLESLGDIEWSKCYTAEETEKVLDKLVGYLTEDQLSQARESLRLVEPIELTAEQVPFPEKVSDKELREKSYMRLNMQSLIE